MRSDDAYTNARIEEIILRNRRQQWKAGTVLYLLPGSGLVAMLLFDWIFDLGPEWTMFRFWLVQAPIILWVLIMLMLGIGRPRFVRDFFDDAEPQLSDAEQAKNAELDETQKKFEQLVWPLRWLTTIAIYGCLLNLLFWWNGEITMTTELGIATALFGIIACLGVLAHRRIHHAYHIRVQ